MLLEMESKLIVYGSAHRHLQAFLTLLPLWPFDLKYRQNCYVDKATCVFVLQEGSENKNKTKMKTTTK